MPIEKKIFTGGLDTDTEDRFLPIGDYRYALNITDTEKEGVIENLKGNLVLRINLPNGTNRVIGSCDWIEENKVIYFMFNSLANHTIYEYDAKTNVISIILQSYFLRFSSIMTIHDAFVINGMLYFNDTTNQPRSINIERAKTNGYPSPFREEYINASIKAPKKPPIINFKNSSDLTPADNRKTNSLRNKLFQFRYKYVYLDEEESAWSPISKVALPFSESQYRPLNYYPTEINNVITVEINSGNNYVKRIKIAAREQNTGDFFLAADLDKTKLNITPSVGYLYNFFNDEAYTSLDNDGNTGMRLYDNIPQLADSQSLIDGNKIAYGGITAGYDPIDIDVDITVNTETSTAQPPPQIDYGLNYLKPEDFGEGIILIKNGGSRVFNGIGYTFLKLSQLSYRRSPVASGTYLTGTGWHYLQALGGFVGGSFNTIFQAGLIRDRHLTIKNETTGEYLSLSGSGINEIIIHPPTGAGIRYVLKIRLSYYDLGYGDTQKDKWVKVQYITTSTDTATSVANELLQLIIGVSVLTENLVDLRLDHSEVASYSYGLGSQIPSGTAMLRIYGEAYIPSSRKDNDPSPSFPTATGADTGVLHFLWSTLESYSSWTTKSEKTLKSGATHGVGMVYYDDINRSGLTNISTQKTFYVPFFSERNIPNGEIPNPTTLTMKINHTAPSWAKVYQIVYTGNQTIEYLPNAGGYKGFVQFQLKDVVPSAISGALEATIQNIIDFNNETPEDIDLGYNYNKGDRIRFITNPITPSSENFLQTYSDVEVISFESSTNIITFKKPNITISNDQVVEIYTPKQGIKEVIYHEIGEAYDVIDGLHQGFINQTSTTPATIELNNIGDVYLRYRVSPVYSIVEDYSFSDYYTSDSWDKGRPNKVDNNIKRVKRDAVIRFSNVYIPDTNINGLSRFDDFDFKEYDQKYGNIQKLYSKDKNLLVFQTLKVGNIRIGQTTLYGNEGTAIANIKSQDKVLSDIVYYNNEYGIGENPESIIFYAGFGFFTDVYRGVVCSIGSNIIPISEFKMHNYFNDTFKSLVNSDKTYKLFGVYDVRQKKYVLSIQSDVTDIPLEITIPDTPHPIKNYGTQVEVAELSSSTTITTRLATPPKSGTTTNGINNTIAFSVIKKRWVTYYSFVPDYMGLNNIGLLTFKDGELYVHNKGNYCEFYETPYNSIIEFLCNASPSSMKVYNNIFIEATEKYSMTKATNQFGQETSLIEDDFVDDEGVYKSSFLRDKNTPNVTNALIEGDDMRCHSMLIRLENSKNSVVRLFSVGIDFVLSHLTNR